MAHSYPIPTMTPPLSPQILHYSTVSDRSSMLYTMLPASVQSRIPRLPSIRKSVKLYGCRNVASSTPNTSRPTSSDSSISNAKGEEKSTMILAGEIDYFTSSSADSSGDEEQVPRLPPRSLASHQRQSDDGITWKFASQGFNLLNLAIAESSNTSQDPNGGNVTFTRQLYFHSLVYLLRGMPPDLSPAEALSIRGALPPAIVDPLRVEVSSSSQSTSSPPASQAQQPSILHRTLATTIINLFILFQFILPYIRALLAMAYQYERTHHVTEKFLRSAVEGVDTLGKKGIGFGERVCGLAEGRTGQLVVGAVEWFVDGVVGGVRDGVQGGVGIATSSSAGNARERVHVDGKFP